MNSVYIKQNGIQVCRAGISFWSGSQVSIGGIYTGSATFVCTHSTLVTQLNPDAQQIIFGNGTLNETWVMLEEIPYTEATTDW